MIFPEVHGACVIIDLNHNTPGQDRVLKARPGHWCMNPGGLKRSDQAEGYQTASMEEVKREDGGRTL